jgi:RimJ/RimL family protein N-acetyltransferase
MISPMLEPSNSLTTERLVVRHPAGSDRARFVELFCDERFMVFSNAAMSQAQANRRFDRMLTRCAEISFAKQPVVERSSQNVVGYTGVDWIEFEGRRWLEWGYRLTTDARDKGYATEASLALLDYAVRHYTGELLGIIHPENGSSHRVIRKLGFEYWKRAPVEGEMRDLYRLDIGHRRETA